MAILSGNLTFLLGLFSRVQHFPYNPNLLQVIQQHPEFRNAIEYLCAFENPDPDKIECVAAVLLGAWVSSEKSNASVMEVLQKAQEYTSSYIRSFRQDFELDPEVEQILGAVPHSIYNLTKGFLHWQFQSELLAGTLPYSTDTPRFQR